MLVRRNRGASTDLRRFQNPFPMRSSAFVVVVVAQANERNANRSQSGLQLQRCFLVTVTARPLPRTPFLSLNLRSCLAASAHFWTTSARPPPRVLFWASSVSCCHSGSDPLAVPIKERHPFTHSLFVHGGCFTLPPIQRHWVCLQTDAPTNPHV